MVVPYIILTMKPVLNIYKPIGKTPYDMVKKVKELYPELAEKKIGYAGRLDPMAHGVLLLLVGDTNKQKKAYELLPKAYTFEVIFGIQTDSFDLLGKVKGDYVPHDKDLKKILEKEIKRYNGSFTQTYPPYSAIRLNGKPLYYWELRGKLSKDEIPQKEVTLKSFKLESIGSISSKSLYALIKMRIGLVNGNFRQKELLKYWELFFQKNNNRIFTTAKFSIDCSSGTYVRSIVDDMGKKIGCGGTTLSILRTSVGSYTVKESILMEIQEGLE